MVSSTRMFFEIRNYILQGRMQYGIAEDDVEVKRTIKVSTILKKDDILSSGN